MNVWEPIKEKEEPIVLDYLEAKTNITKILKLDRLLFGDDKERSVKFTYLNLKDEKVIFDTSITINEGEFLAMQKLVDYSFPFIIGW